MTELFLFSFVDLILLLGAENIFYISLAIMTVLCSLCTVIGATKRSYGFVKRCWIILVSVAVMSINVGAELIVNNKIIYLPFLCAFNLVCLSIALFVPKKENEISSEQINFARRIDCKARSENEQNSDIKKPFNLTKQPLEVLKVQQENEPKNQKSDLDFSHVKTILSKLDFYSLKENDRKQIKELETNLVLAEQEGLDQRAKESINDGLGALLKIMSKYGI